MEAATRGQFRGAGVVVHLYDADSKLGASLDLLLEAKAGSYMGTRLVVNLVQWGRTVSCAAGYPLVVCANTAGRMVRSPNLEKLIFVHAGFLCPLPPPRVVTPKATTVVCYRCCHAVYDLSRTVIVFG